MKKLCARFFILAFALLLPSLAIGQDTDEEGGSGNWMESLFNTVEEAAEDPETREGSESAVDGALDFLNTLNQQSEEAREEVLGTQYLDPDDVEAMMRDANERIEEVHNELDAVRTRLIATDLSGVGGIEPGPRRITPLRVLATGLKGSPLLRFVALRDVEITRQGAILATGHYARHGYVGTTALRSSTAELGTDHIEVPALSQAEPKWLLESYGDAGSSIGMQIEAAADGVYVLALSQAGPTHIAGVTVDHSKYDSFAYLTRLDSSGEPRWIAALARPPFDPNAATMATGTDGTVYVGYRVESIYGVPVATGQDLRTGTARYDESYTRHQLLAAYDARGRRLWQTVAERVTVRNLVTGEDGALYASGHFSESSNFCGGIRTDGDQAAFVARFAANGSCDWITTTSGSTGRRTFDNRLLDEPGGINSFPALAVDGDALYVGGSFHKETEFAGSSFEVDEGSSVGLVARLDARTGSRRWVRTSEAEHAPGAPPVDIEGGYVHTAQIVPGGRGDIYVLESRREWKRGDDEEGTRIDARILRMDAHGNVVWQEPTGVSTALYDTGGYQPPGVKLVPAESGPPYLLVQDLGFSMDGVTMAAADEGVWYVAIGRLGR